MPTECSQDSFDFGTVEGRAVVGAFDGGAITSDGGALLLGATDKAVRLIARFAACFTDARDPTLIEHSIETLVGQRVFGLALGYEDLNDHDELRNDPVMATLAGKLEARREDCAPLAGKSTLNRLEQSLRGGVGRYHKIGHDAAAIEALFVEMFLDAYGADAGGHPKRQRNSAPAEIVLDLDATDDPLHGHQEGRFFHGYYDAYCYLPLYIFCGRHLLAAKLRRANIDAAAGAVEETARIVAQIRTRWPRVRIILRADSGFCRDDLMSWCEANRVDYVLGLARNPRLEAEIAHDLDLAEIEATTLRVPVRRYRDFTWTTRDSWSRERRVVAKAEWITGKANPRFVVTSLSKGRLGARELYEDLY
ncbi:MAG: IS1380 family transposase, partial [Rhodocyclaceae bacterium]|nr:IS1380 family transposase [Rhodocyclaceae bacterium]